MSLHKGPQLKRVIIGGGSGFVGGQLVRRLRQCGFFPVVVARDFERARAQMEPEGSTLTYGELEKGGRIPPGIFGVVNLSGANIAVPFRSFDAQYKDIVRKSRIGTTSLLRHLIQQTPAEERPKVFVKASAIGIYPPSETAEYDEDSAPKPSSSDDFFQKLVQDWEASGVLPDDAGVRQAIIRTGLVLGRTGGIVAQSFAAFYAGVGGPMGSGRQWFPWVHVDDVCGIILHCLEQDHVSGVLNAVSPNPVTNKQFASAFGAALGRPAFVPVPAFAVRLMFGAERAAMFLSGQKVIPVRTLELGYEFIYPGIAEAAAEFARFRTSEELGRLRSNGEPISRFGAEGTEAI